MPLKNSRKKDKIPSPVNLREALTLVVIGLVISAVAPLLMTKTAESFYDLKPNDPLTIRLAT
jgi:hypothetical protein